MAATALFHDGDGNRVAYVTAVYEARVAAGPPVVRDDELSELASFGTGELPALG